MLKDLNLMLLTEHLAVLRTGDRDAIEQRMLEMATALDGEPADVLPGLSSANSIVQSYLAFLNSADVNELSPEVHVWLLEFMTNHRQWTYSDNRSRDSVAVARLFAISDDAAVRAVAVTAAIAGDQNILDERNVRETELTFTPALWGALREALEDRSVISSRALELTETFIDLWIVPESHELAGRCLQDLFAYSRRAELIPMEQIQSVVAERAEEIGGRLGDELGRMPR